MAKFTVKDTEITVVKIKDEDYLCLTDMLKAKDGDFFITDWLRNRNTLEYIGIWEKVYNPSFNYGEFAIIKSQAGLNSFKISVKEFVEKTNAISIQAKAGRYGGTYAHKDIAFEFAMWISPEFKIYIVYADEADMLNVAMFGMTAKQWREANQDLKGNIRDYATINQLICLSNMENLNAVFINDGMPQSERLEKLNKIAIQQMKILENIDDKNLLTDGNK